MVIKYKEYLLTQDNSAVERFNLTRKVMTVAKQDLKSGVKEGEEYEREDESGYGYTLESGIQKIIAFEFAKKDDVVDLKGYLKEYRALKSEISKLLEA
jgi:hypothetical protein